MDYQQPFSVLNERLRPRVTASEQLYLSLNRLEDRQLSSLRSRSSPYQTVLSEPVSPTLSGPEVSVDDPEEGDCDDLVSGTTCLITEMNIKDFDDDSSSSKSDEKDTSGELSSEGGPGTPESDGPFQRGYVETSLPDLIKSGRPLGRRRTVGHVSQTLKEVRREVELSRRRSIKLKAQVDKLQERREGPGWSQDRERVTEEVLSVLRLLFPLTDSSFKQPELSEGASRLDAALDQLQKVARSLAVSHTAKQEFRSGKEGSEESAVLQQALRDRDEAIEKKKAMEAELLRSRTEMMVLNNQVLEAAQKRLEMSLELEAWKEDFQLLLHQQVQSQQLAEQAQKKSSRGLGILRRKGPPIQRPSSFPLQSPSPTPSSRLAAPVSPVPKTALSVGGTWRDKLRRGKPSRTGDQDAAGNDSDYSRDDDGFQVISLD
ncbi:bicaudal-D-related protein 2-like [Salarias fasciatus]|uniref:bicaudal-D-related protein 2-like n=1 Tax=Salarias fasciatus TaxID=181472 RepID=UPI001176F911|nr:uncharacterized protein LOC115395356 [Salarias fasciatus]